MGSVPLLPQSALVHTSNRHWFTPPAAMPQINATAVKAMSHNEPVHGRKVDDIAKTSKVAGKIMAMSHKSGKHLWLVQSPR